MQIFIIATISKIALEIYGLNIQT